METLDPPPTDPDNKNRGGRATLVISGGIKGPVIIYRRGKERRILS